MRVLMTVCLALCLAAPAAAFDADYEQRNYDKINERARTDYTPAFNMQLAAQGAENQAAAASILAEDGPQFEYGRDFSGNLCSNPMNGCAGDVRLYNWGEKGYGVVKPILFTARNGSTLSGHVWMTKAGPAKRPGVVITNGSVQAPETLYWFAAQTLAKAGYVVMTWDPQGQGFSDTYGEGQDRMDGVPSQSGQPFFDGTEDALDFFFSTPDKVYSPRRSCSSGTLHTDKQDARVRSGRSSAYNPFSDFLDTSRVGIVGHSLGAAAVSYVGQLDPRVKAIVAYDNLRDVTKPLGFTCKSGASARPETLTITKPALGMSSDYGLTPMMYSADPTPEQMVDKQAGSIAASKAGVDTGELMIRGGTHYEFSYIPNQAFGATSRGIDMVSWYTTAWMDRQLKGDPSATARLETTRWRNDEAERAVDTQDPKDGNLFSTYYKSRLNLPNVFGCEDLRTGCDGQPADDGVSGPYSFLAAAQTPDSEPTKGSTTAFAGANGVPPAATGPITEAPRLKEDTSCSKARARIAVVHRARKGLRIAGFAKGCVKRVEVSVALRAGSRCRLATGKSLSTPTSCNRTRFLRARGQASWVIKVRGIPPRARYVVRARAVAASGKKTKTAVKRTRT